MYNSFFSNPNPTPDVPKYIFENGVMKINPAYKQEQANQGTPSTVDQSAIAIVSSTSDVMQASQVQQQATGQPLRLSEATTSSMEIMQDKEFLDKFQSPRPMDGGEVLDKLTSIFAKYEVPIGLVNKLLALQQYELNFIIDDSGSMTMSSDAPVNQATRYVLDRKRARGDMNSPLTRWEEAEDRVHIMMDMIAFIPTNKITISFLNRSDVITLEHRGKDPQMFADDAHRQIMNVFNRQPSGGTPIYERLNNAFNRAMGPTMHYLFTDGVPTDRSIHDVENLVLSRRTPESNPLTFMSCTDQDDETIWMKEIEERAPYCAELDDFDDEKREVMHDQGPSFPFSKGFWLLCQMVAAINPDDLDAMDESRPFTKYTLDTLMGRQTTDAEYKYYWDAHPMARQYNQYFQRFATEKTVARVIIPNGTQPGQGYPNQPGQPGGGYPTQPGQGYPNQGGGYPTQPGQGYPNQGGGYPTQPGQGYPNQPGQGYPQYPNNQQPSQPTYQPRRP